MLVWWNKHPYLGQLEAPNCLSMRLDGVCVCMHTVMDSSPVHSVFLAFYTVLIQIR